MILLEWIFCDTYRNGSDPIFLDTLGLPQNLTYISGYLTYYSDLI